MRVCVLGGWGGGFFAWVVVLVLGVGWSVFVYFALSLGVVFGWVVIFLGVGLGELASPRMGLGGGKGGLDLGKNYCPDVAWENKIAFVNTVAKRTQPPPTPGGKQKEQGSLSSIGGKTWR